MELPQPRPFGTQGKATHDFLSFYSQIQDPVSSQGGNSKTHDFLQPLERVNKYNAKEESIPMITTSEKPMLPVARLSGEHVLPGGIGTYSIGNISYFNQRVLKPEGGLFTAAQTNILDQNDENSNGSSHTGSGFTLWEESAVKKGKTRKENYSGDRQRPGGKIGGGQRAALERPSQSSSTIANSAPAQLTNTSSFNSRSSSQPLSQKKSFMDMLKSAKAAHDEDEEEEEEYGLKKEVSPPPLKGELTVRVGSGGGKNIDQKPNTPRSKHSATEQRRRSKINDRFHMLRELIPNSDQKRDKASFLLEVIEYIQYLQEKVHKYEVPYQGWNQELPKLMRPLQRSNNHADGYTDQSPDQINDPVTTMAFTAKFDENSINFSSTNPLNAQKTTGPDMKTITNSTAADDHFGLTTSQTSAMQKNIFTLGGNACTISPTPSKGVADMQNTISLPQPQYWQMPHVPDCDTAYDKLKEQDLTIESGVISISSVYSQELLNSLTQALQSSGVDMSQATISVQVDLGKRAKCKATATTSAVKDDGIRYSDQGMMASRGASSNDELNKDRKRLRTS